MLFDLSLLLSVGAALPQQQVQSLLAFFNATGGPNWLDKTNWNNQMDPCDPLWCNVDCDVAKENVIGLYTKNNNLTGSLPDLHLPALVVL